MKSPLESPTAIAPLPQTLPGAASGASDKAAAADLPDSTMIVLRNELHWLRTRLAVAAAGAATLVLVSVYWPAANAGAGVKRLPPPAVEAKILKTLPPVAFQTKTLVDAGGRARERDARLLLKDGKMIVTVKDVEQTVRELPLRDVRSISYSHGRDPLWSSPTGPALVGRSAVTGLARIGIGGRRHWISVETNAAVDGLDRFVVLQTADQAVRPILSALQERTGLTPRTIPDR